MINKCCNVTPTVHEVDEVDRSGYDAIECYECGRVIYGNDDESIKEWNKGEGNDN